MHAEPLSELRQHKFAKEQALVVNSSARNGTRKHASFKADPTRP